METGWHKALESEWEQSYFQGIQSFLAAERKVKKQIYPPSDQIFSAFKTTPWDAVQVVILGQDPYHQAHQAHGMAFSVPKGVSIPPSLRNIYKELEQDLGLKPSQHGHLQSWAQQGVLLLNASLSVEAGKPNSHAQCGWHQFTDEVLRRLSHQKEYLVFLLWGTFAQQKESLIDGQKHLILKTSHPSPFSAHKGFLGSRPFSQTNDYLIENGKEPIDWALKE